MLSVPITTKENKVVSLNPAHDDTTLCDKFVGDLRQVDGFLWVLWFHPPINMTEIYINEILLKVVLSTNILTLELRAGGS